MSVAAASSSRHDDEDVEMLDAEYMHEEPDEKAEEEAAAPALPGGEMGEPDEDDDHDEGDEDEEASSDNGLLVDNIELLGDGGGKKTCAEDDGAGFGDKARGGGEAVDDFGGALFRWGLGGAGHAAAGNSTMRMDGHVSHLLGGCICE